MMSISGHDGSSKIDAEPAPRDPYLHRRSFSHLDNWIKAVRHLSCSPNFLAPRIRRSQSRVSFSHERSFSPKEERCKSVPSLSSSGGTTGDDTSSLHHSVYQSPLLPLPASPLKVNVHDVQQDSHAHPSVHFVDDVNSGGGVPSNLSSPIRKASTTSAATTPTGATTAVAHKVLCPFPACGAMILPRELEHHQRAAHVLRKTPTPTVTTTALLCGHCLIAFPSKRDRDGHEGRCLEALVDCPLGCGKRFTRRELAGHMYTSWRSHDVEVVERSLTQVAQPVNAEHPAAVVATLLRTLHDEERAATLRLTLASRSRQTLDWLRDNYPNHRSLLGTLHRTLSTPRFPAAHPPPAVNVTSSSPGESSLHRNNPTLEDIVSDVEDHSSLHLEPLDTPIAVPLHYQLQRHNGGGASNAGMSVTSDVHFDVVSGAPSFALEERGGPLGGCLSRASLMESSSTSHVEFTVTQVGASDELGVVPGAAAETGRRSSILYSFESPEAAPLNAPETAARHGRRSAALSDSGATIGFEEEVPPPGSNGQPSSFLAETTSLLGAIAFHDNSIHELIHVVSNKTDATDGVLASLEQNVAKSVAVIAEDIAKWRQCYSISAERSHGSSGAWSVTIANGAATGSAAPLDELGDASVAVEEAWRRLDRTCLAWKQAMYTALYSDGAL